MALGVRLKSRTRSTSWPGAAVGTSTRATSDTKTGRTGRGGEAGFTLVEALVAIVVLIFGLMAVTNLMLVAASSNSVANQGTAAVTSAIRAMDMIKATSFNQLEAGGETFDVADAGGAMDCSSKDLLVTSWHCNDQVPGV